MPAYNNTAANPPAAKNQEGPTMGCRPRGWPPATSRRPPACGGVVVVVAAANQLPPRDLTEDGRPIDRPLTMSDALTPQERGRPRLRRAAVRTARKTRIFPSTIYPERVSRQTEHMKSGSHVLISREDLPVPAMFSSASLRVSVS